MPSRFLATFTGGASNTPTTPSTRPQSTRRKSRNHLVDQIESLRIGDKTTNEKTIFWIRFCYGSQSRLGITKASEEDQSQIH